jgi:signal transduction histidine kinase
MKTRISITTKFLVGVVLVLLINIILVFMVTAFQIESASKDAYEVELDTSFTTIMSVFEKLESTTEADFDMKASLDKFLMKYPYKIVVIKDGKVIENNFINQSQYESMKKNGPATFSMGMKRYFYRAYETGTTKYSSQKILIAKQIPLINDRMKNVLQLSGVAIVLISVPTISLLFLIFRRMSNQIVAVRNATIQVADGNFDEEIEVQSNDEIGDLASSINEMTKRLKQSEADRDAFLASVSHELRTPLTTLKANTKGILDRIIPADQIRKYLLSNVEEIDRLTIMVNDLILASSFEQNKVLVKEHTNLNELLSSVISQMGIVGMQKGITFSCHIESQLEKDVDRLKLKQVFVNVIDNAVKYSKKWSTITIIAKKLGDKVVISITDSGCGIEFKDTNKIFDRFCKGKNSSGLGLGMYISKLIVNAHGGKIKAYNNPNSSGATIEIVL